MDEVLRMDIDRALIILRGQNVLEVNKFDYSKHPEAKKLRPSKASSHIPEWRKVVEEAHAVFSPQVKDTPVATPPKRKATRPSKPISKEKIVTASKDSILSKPKKED